MQRIAGSTAAYAYVSKVPTISRTLLAPSSAIAAGSSSKIVIEAVGL